MNAIKSSVIVHQSGKLWYITHHGIQHIALILIFPTLSEEEKWDVWVVHHPGQDEETAMSHLIIFLEKSPSPDQYTLICIKSKTIDKCESGFYMLLYTYLGFHSKLLVDFLFAMRNVCDEPDLKTKCWQWIQAVFRNWIMVTFPWRTQLLWDLSNQIAQSIRANETNDESFGNINNIVCYYYSVQMNNKKDKENRKKKTSIQHKIWQE